MKNKKNRFWSFVFSLCPGAGHMYMGFMKMGLSFLLGFMISIALVSLTGLDVLAVIPIVIYIYAFFHANNIASLNDEQFYALEDEYLLGFDSIGAARFQLDRKSRGIAAAVLILIGISMLWNVGFGMLWNYVGHDNPVLRLIYYTMRDDVPRILIAIAIIWFGTMLLRGKKVSEEENTQEPVKRIEQNDCNVSNTENGQNAQDHLNG